MTDIQKAQDCVRLSVDYILGALVDGMELSRSENAVDAAEGRLVVGEIVTLLATLWSAKEPQ
jgi:hypothetical protein